MQIADDGRVFAEDALSLCGYLTDGVSADECRVFVKNMLEIATTAHKHSEDTSNQFSQVRVKLLRVSLLNVLLKS
jgi:hypothetical protein